MIDVLVGDSVCSVNEIVRILEGGPFASCFVSDWRKLARHLDIPLLKVEELGNDILQNKKGTFAVVTELLVRWTSESKTDAKFKTLLGILETKCEWKGMAELLREKLLERKWEDLDVITKKKIMDANVVFMGVQIKLVGLFTTMEKIETENILKKALTGELICQFLSGEIIHLTKNRIPDKPAYYIRRTMSRRRRIDPAIFKKHSFDVFVVHGMELANLSKLAGQERVSKSSRQRHQVTARYISLEFPEDFERICKVSPNKSIHLISHKNETFYWIKSHGEINTIQHYVCKDEETFAEKDFFSTEEDSTSHNRFVCIADCPGMGKSVLLANLCRIRFENCPEKIIIFAGFNQILTNPENIIETLNKDALIHKIASHTSSNELGREIMKQMLKQDKHHVELFIDGFDEVSPNKVESTTKLLKFITSEFKNINLFVTTRPHRRNLLERALRTLSYNIKPFRGSDQTSFMERFWHHEYGILVNTTVQQFSQMLTSTIKLRLQKRQNKNIYEKQINTPKKCDVAGVPLKCKILAEIYKDGAIKYSKAARLSDDCSIDINSIQDLFTKLMTLRFENVDEPKRDYVRDMHFVEAISVLFPGLSEDLKKILHLDNVQVNRDQVNKVGLIESQTGVGNNSALTYPFMHWTYAEYLFAECLTSKLERVANDSNSVSFKLFDILFREILELSDWDINPLFNSTGCDTNDIYEEIVNSYGTHDLQNDCKNLAVQLNMSYEDMVLIYGRQNYLLDLSNQKNTKDYLWQILRSWSKNWVAQPRLWELVEALSSLDYLVPAGKLKSRCYEKGFLHFTLCVFIDSFLVKNQPKWTFINFTPWSQLSFWGRDF